MRLSEETKRLLKSVVDHFDQEDRAARQRQIRTWRKLKLLWENLQHHYYSEVAHDWRIPEQERSAGDADQSYYDKPVNVFRAYLESIIAALSVTVPPITCFPDDADNPDDLTTAKAGNKIAELIFRHNDAPLLWLHSLFIFCTEGMLACYSYPREDKSYGTYPKKKYEDTDEEVSTLSCPLCGEELPEDEFMPDGQDICPQCQQIMNPEMKTSTLTVTRLVGITDEPKSRVCLEVYGGLNVKVPLWARNQQECPYLFYSYETHYSNVLAKYPELRDNFIKGGSFSVSGVYDTYEQWGRLPPQYFGEYPVNNVTTRNCWLRSSAFHVLDEDGRKHLEKIFPLGVKVVLENDFVADAEISALDDCWTLLYNPLADYVHYDPLGLLLTSIQEITNDLISLVIQTVEHGIPQTFANPKVLDFNAYSKQEVIPGGIYPAIPPVGKALSDGFHEVKTATLSGEVLPFANKVQEMGQLISGALPSLFGGQVSGSRTASEYSMSRAQALQRLQTTWKSLTIWWKNIFGKAIPIFIKEMKDDERNVERDKFGNFINVFIRRSELSGKIGRIELEANENLPITWSQQKDTIMQLLETNNELILQTLATPENMPYLRRAIGLTDYVIPNEDDRQKQYEEINQLVNSDPISIPGMPDPMTGMPGPEQEFPSVEIDPDVDNHPLEAQICRSWLISDAGRLCKIGNPSGYKNVLLHMKAHNDQIMMMQQQASMMASGATSEESGEEKAPPTEGEENAAPTVQ